MEGDDCEVVVHDTSREWQRPGSRMCHGHENFIPTEGDNEELVAQGTTASSEAQARVATMPKHQSHSKCPLLVRGLTLHR